MSALMGMEVLVELHDQLLAEMPEGIEHDEESCPLCAEQVAGTRPTQEVNSLADETFTQNDVDAAVATATSALQKEIDELKATMDETEAAQKYAKEKSELDAQIADLQSKLDAAVLEAAETKKTHDEYVESLEAIQQEEQAKQEAAQRREERITKVKEVAAFPDEYVEANADRWSALDEEQFTALLTDWAAIAKRDTTTNGLPQVTAMTAARQTNDDGKSVLREVLNMRFEGIDTRKL